MGFEPTTACLEGRNSTAELLPHGRYCSTAASTHQPLFDATDIATAYCGAVGLGHPMWWTTAAPSRIAASEGDDCLVRSFPRSFSSQHSAAPSSLCGRCGGLPSGSACSGGWATGTCHTKKTVQPSVAMKMIAEMIGRDNQRPRLRRQNATHRHHSTATVSGGAAHCVAVCSRAVRRVKRGLRD